MGNNNFKPLNEHCVEMRRILESIRENIGYSYYLGSLINSLSRKIRETHGIIDNLLREDLETATRRNLRQIKTALAEDQFTEINDDINEDLLKFYMSLAINDMYTICEMVDRIEEENSLSSRFISWFGNLRKVFRRALAIEY